MGNERPASLSFADGYLLVADVCGRAEFLERIARYHALGKLPMSGLPNRTGERRHFPQLSSTDYRLAFGAGGSGAMAVRKDLAHKWLPGGSISQPRPIKWPLFAPGPAGNEWRAPTRSIPAPQPGRLLLAENDTEIDERAYSAIVRACTRAKRGDAPLVFTDLQFQLGGKELIRLFHKGPGAAPANPPALTAAEVREILREAIAEKNKNQPGRALSQRDAVDIVKRIDPQFDRDAVREIMRELTNNRPRGRPKLIGGK
jgi:hypothetical protein